MNDIKNNDLSVQCDQFVATVTILRSPHNHLDAQLVAQLADAFEKLDEDSKCRTIVVAAEGKSFCAGADFSKPREGGTIVRSGGNIYKQAARLFRTRKPIIAAVHGAAIGGGLGLAMMADFRVTCDQARFSANFTRLGTHPGFGLTATLPRAIGHQQTALLIYTGRRISGAEAVRIGLADVLVQQSEVGHAAWQLAKEIAASAPKSVMSVRETLRRGLAEEVERATERELTEQSWQFLMDDFKEGSAAMLQRVMPNFRGQ
ncbi:enoyl-CoA hydratase/isomerase family protein [Bordetella tumulicola]|uniref:enoyl-CoA hydratase/isomerase family protein n=1 Tax=Bordetella tumulicola TaxID=1649133 RepID=UPI0039EFF76F